MNDAGNISAADRPQLVARLEAFVRGIGIEVVREKLAAEEEFLPGILARRGVMVVDEERLAYPGDIIYQAGALAVMRPSERTAFVKKREFATQDQRTTHDILITAWCFAAVSALELPPETVFHEGGYQGASRWLVESFKGGNYLGLPGLQWIGLAADAENAAKLGVAPYPHMIRWLREEDELPV